MRTYVWDAETTTDDLLVNIVETKPDGMIVISELPEGALEQLANIAIPVVLIDGKAFVDGIFDSVRANNYLGGRLAARHLLDNGHVRFAYLGDAEQSVSFRERLNGFRDQIQKTMPQAPFVGVTSSAKDCGDTEFLYCPEELDRLLETMPTPFAVMCANDVTAALLYERITKTNLRIPDDISVVGFDNVLLSSTYRPPLTSINVHKKEIGQIAVDLILERIKHPERSKQSVMVNVELIERKSVATWTHTVISPEASAEWTTSPLPTKEIL
jgi:DNA-binding LacI/PurR family transcriptional regulator